jgi:hypothetical protein
MNRHPFSRARLAGHTITIALTILISATLLLATTLDHAGGHSELQDALRAGEDAALARSQARALASNSARLAIAASAICHQEQGSSAEPGWTPEGELVCLPGSQKP